MDIVRIASKLLGESIVIINEEDAMEEILQVLCAVPIKRLVNFIANGLSALPEGTTIGDLLENEEKYDDILDESFNPNDLFTEEELAELQRKICGEEEEPE